MSIKNGIVFASDHGGFELKTALVAYLKEFKPNLKVYDKGSNPGERVDYPDYASLACKTVLEKECLGVVVCGTGIGISIAANKYKGIRCALCHDHYTAKMCRQHNNANILALGGRTTGIEVAKEILDTFILEEFAGDRHAKRLEKITGIEKEQ